MAALRKPDVPPPPEKKGPALIFSFPSDLSARVRLFAAERREHAQSMVAALVDYMIATGKADEMLDALRGAPRLGQGRVMAGGQMLTRHQAAVLVVIGANRDADGFCRLSCDSMVHLTGIPLSGTRSVLASLVRRKLVRNRDCGSKRYVVLPRGLTATGEAAWHELAVDDLP